MSLRKLLFILLAAASVCSCAEKETGNEPQTPTPENLSLKAYTESLTKTAIGEDYLSVLWGKGDKVSILAGGQNVLYTVDAAGNASSLSSQTPLTEDVEELWGVFPYSENQEVGDDASVIVTVPSVQQIDAPGMNAEANVAVARLAAVEKGKVNEVDFYNVCAYLSFDIADAERVSECTIYSEPSSSLAGSVKVKMDAEGLPYIDEVLEGMGQITVSSRFPFDGKYLVPVLPCSVPSVYYMDVKYSDETVAEKVYCTDGEVILRRGKVTAIAGKPVEDAPENPTLSLSKAYWSDAHVSWILPKNTSSVTVYLDGQQIGTSTSDENSYHLTGLGAGTEHVVKIEATVGDEQLVSNEVKFTTGAITQLTKNVSPTSVAVAIENRAGVLKYNAETKITGPSIYVELYKGDDRTAPVYATYVLDKEKISMGHPFFNSLVVSNSKTWAEDYPLNLAFGALEAGTDYWFRVRSAEDYTYSTYTANKYEMKTNSSKGVSEWSEFVRLSTQPSHEATSDEALFQGFDDCSMEHDFINCAVGIMPAFGGGSVTEAASTAGGKYPAMFAGWTNGWCFYGLRTNMKMTDIFNCGWLGQMTTAGEYKYYTVENITGKPCIAPAFAASVTADSRIGSMRTTMSFKGFTGWNFTNACYPHEGYMAMGSYYDGSDAVASRKAAIMTPALSDPLTDEETDVVLTFRALAVQGRTGVLGVYKHNGTKGAANWSEVTSVNIKNSNGVTENSSEWSAMNDTHKWYDYSVEFKMKKGDALGFGTDGNACICIDDICVKIKK